VARIRGGSARHVRRAVPGPVEGSVISPFWENQLMSGEVPIEIEDKPTAVSIMRELVEHLQDTIEALKREIVRNPKSDEYRKALKGTSERFTIAKQILAREEARTSH
jgi:hypothetical protein